MSDTNPQSRYAGDLTPQEAWSLLASDRTAQMIDVRTQAEWTFVGVPDLSSLERDASLIEWQSLPSMAVDPAAFAEKASRMLHTAGANSDTPVLMLCRSGGRSRAAAIALTNAGYTRVYNISGGFEGDLDSARHRGTSNGWKAASLPWRQT